MSERSPDKRERLPADIRARLISYANCNRCELTPDDARQIVLLDDMTATPERRSSPGLSEIKPDGNEERSGEVDREGGGSADLARGDAMGAGRSECGSRAPGHGSDREGSVTGGGISVPSSTAPSAQDVMHEIFDYANLHHAFRRFDAEPESDARTEAREKMRVQGAKIVRLLSAHSANAQKVLSEERIGELAASVRNPRRSTVEDLLRRALKEQANNASDETTKP